MKSLVRSFKELIFSQKCPICKMEVEGDYYLCNSCYRRLRNKRKLRNQGNYYYCYYYDSDIKRVIIDFKLKNRKKLGLEIAGLIEENLHSFLKEKNIDIVLPVPISRKRLSERGYNQVELLLDYCNVKYSKIYREKDTEHMYKLLNRKARLKNIRNVFNIKELSLDGKNILIVDDIVTTGATIKEIIREIEKNATPKKIYVFSIAVARIFKME